MGISGLVIAAVAPPHYSYLTSTSYSGMPHAAAHTMHRTGCFAKRLRISADSAAQSSCSIATDLLQ